MRREVGADGGSCCPMGAGKNGSFAHFKMGALIEAPEIRLSASLRDRDLKGSFASPISCILTDFRPPVSHRVVHFVLGPEWSSLHD